VKHDAAAGMNEGRMHADMEVLAQQLPLSVICSQCGKRFKGPLALTRQWWKSHAATHGIDVDLANALLVRRRGLVRATRGVGE
jgi:N-formylglutamate amidohydrolase